MFLPASTHQTWRASSANLEFTCFLLCFLLSTVSWNPQQRQQSCSCTKVGLVHLDGCPLSSDTLWQRSTPESDWEIGWQKAFTTSGRARACKIEESFISPPEACVGAEEGNLGGSMAETASLGGIWPSGLSAFIKEKKEKHNSFRVLSRCANYQCYLSTCMVIFYSLEDRVFYQKWM